MINFQRIRESDRVSDETKGEGEIFFFFFAQSANDSNFLFASGNFLWTIEGTGAPLPYRARSRTKDRRFYGTRVKVAEI